MRHAWVELSRNVSICRKCGGKRIREKQSGPWRSSIPEYRYEFHDGKSLNAGGCLNEWPQTWEPQWRVSFYKPMPQQELFAWQARGNINQRS